MVETFGWREDEELTGVSNISDAETAADRQTDRGQQQQQLIIADRQARRETGSPLADETAQAI